MIIEEKAITVAQSLGSSARTPRGAIRYLAGCQRGDIARAVRPRITRMSRAQYKHDHASRKSDPEAKRAIKDKVFRKKYLARLLRAERRILRCDSGLDAAMLFADEYGAKHKAWRELQKLRATVTGVWDQTKNGAAYPMGFPRNRNGIMVPLADGNRACAATARRAGVKVVMRGRDWSVAPCREASHHEHFEGETEWSGGRPSNYTRAVNNTWVRSIAVIVSPTVVDYMLHETRHTVTLPHGLHWERAHESRLGRLVAVADECTLDDFHPSADDLVSGGAHVAQKLAENREARHRLSAEVAAEAADSAGIYVCAADSTRAGNCPQGTSDFAARHDLDSAKHYTASDLLAIANGEAGRVRLAIKSATLRHHRESEKGFCVMADHYWDC